MCLRVFTFALCRLSDAEELLVIDKVIFELVLISSFQHHVECPDV